MKIDVDFSDLHRAADAMQPDQYAVIDYSNRFLHCIGQFPTYAAASDFVEHHPNKPQVMIVEWQGDDL